MPPLKEVHNTLNEAQLRGRTPAKGRGLKTNNANAAAGGPVKPSGTSGLKVPKLRGFSKPQACSSSPNIHPSRNDPSSTEQENVPKAPATTAATGGLPAKPAAKRAAIKKTKSATAKASDKAPQSAPKRAIDSTPKPSTTSNIGRRKRGQPARFGEWVEGTPAAAAPTPSNGAHQTESASADEATDASWQAESARQKVEGIQRQMAQLSEALPDVAIPKNQKEEAKQIPLQERLKTTWAGKSYYDRLAAMNPAPGSESEADVPEERFENFTDALLRHGLKSNKRRSMAAMLSAMPAPDVMVVEEETSQPAHSGATEESSTGANKPSVCGSAPSQGLAAKGRPAKPRAKAAPKAIGKAKQPPTASRSGKDAKKALPAATPKDEPLPDTTQPPAVTGMAEADPNESPIIGISYAEVAELRAEVAQLRQLLDDRSSHLRESICVRDQLSAELERERAEHTMLKQEMQNIQAEAMKEFGHGAEVLLSKADDLSQLAHSMTTAASKLSRAQQ